MHNLSLPGFHICCKIDGVFLHVSYQDPLRKWLILSPLRMSCGLPCLPLSMSLMYSDFILYWFVAVNFHYLQSLC